MEFISRRIKEDELLNWVYPICACCSNDWAARGDYGDDGIKICGFYEDQ